MAQLKNQLSAILKQHAGIRENGRVASERTKTARGDALRAGFERLYALGYRLQKPENIGEKHIEALVKS